MTTLNFSLTPEAAARVHDVLVCLGKFSDTVAIEARRERFAFTALNSSKSAYAVVALDGKQFLSNYNFIPSHGGPEGRFTCSMYTKALLSVFKSRLNDSSDGNRAGSIDHCEVSVQDRAGEAQCRFIIKMVCNQGVVKTYRLTYEPVDVFHALFDKNVAQNRWSISAQSMKYYMENFGTKTESLDIYSGDDGRVVFKSFTEKIASGKEIYKHPLVTAVSASTSAFEHYSVQTGLHVIISVKDFRAIVVHADTLETSINAFYSLPTRPLQFNYHKDGMSCEFTLMTSGDYNASVSLAPTPQQIIDRSISRAQSMSMDNLSNRSSMPPPIEPASRRPVPRRAPVTRRAVSPTRTQPEEDPESLFVGQNEEAEDAQWEPIDYNDEDETLGWDASADHANTVFPTFRDSDSGSGNLSRAETEESIEVVAPTQRVSQVQGLW